MGEGSPGWTLCGCNREENDVQKMHTLLAVSRCNGRCGGLGDLNYTPT